MAMTFPLGQTMATPGALDALKEVGLAPADLLDRHAAGDWGEMSDHDRRMNEVALAEGERLLSGYTLPGGTRIWVVTEADRTMTTLLLPDEY